MWISIKTYLPDLILSSNGARNRNLYTTNRWNFLCRSYKKSYWLWALEGLTVADFQGDGDWELYATNQGLSPFVRGYDNFLHQLPNNDTKLMTTLPILSNPEEREDILQSLKSLSQYF